MNARLGTQAFHFFEGEARAGRCGTKVDLECLLREGHPPVRLWREIGGGIALRDRRRVVERLVRPLVRRVQVRRLSRERRGLVAVYVRWRTEILAVGRAVRINVERGHAPAAVYAPP